MVFFKFEKFWNAFIKLWGAVPYTLAIILVSMLFASILGLGLAAMKMSKKGWVRRIGYIYSAAVRATPFLVLLFVVFYGLPALTRKMGFSLDDKGPLFFVFFSLMLMGASRLSDVFRSAYEAVDKGQMEAAYSVGLTGPQALFRIVVPQAFYIAIPNLGNNLLIMMLETSLGYNIGAFDLMGTAKQMNALQNGANTLEIYLATALIYWMFALILDRVFTIIERRLGRHYKSLSEGAGKKKSFKLSSLKKGGEVNV